MFQTQKARISLTDKVNALAAINWFNADKRNIIKSVYKQYGAPVPLSISCVLWQWRKSVRNAGIKAFL
jgi:hypothetical protein